MPNVYSRLLWANFLTQANSSVSGQVPAGFVWVVRSVTVCQWNTDLGFREWWQLTDAAGTMLAGEPRGVGSTGVATIVDMHQVVEAPDNLAFQTGVPGWSLRVSGYVLTLP